jgi:hypothetical protein
MDMSTAFQSLNWFAIIVAALSTFLIGGLWYSPLMFQKAWVNAKHYEKLKIIISLILIATTSCNQPSEENTKHQEKTGK